MNVYLDNIPVTYKTLTLMKPVINWRKKDEEGFKAFSFTGDIQFVSTDYDYIKSKLWDNIQNGQNVSLQTEVVLRFEDECCNDNPFPFEFNIKAESILWCEGSCMVTAAAIETSQEEKALRCIRNTLIFDDTPTNWSDGVPFTQRQHPRFTYCNEIRPQWQHLFLIEVGICLGLLAQVLTPIIAIISALISGVNNAINAINTILSTNIDTITFKNNPEGSFYQSFLIFKDKLLSQIIGCGKKHPSPLVRDYAQNVCRKCNLNFRSSIFMDAASDYFNACYHFAPVDKGTDVNDTTSFWIDNNKPIKTGAGYFDQLCNLFNGEWKITGTDLIFERRDFFINKAPWLDLTNMLDEDYDICYSWSKRNRYAFGDFSYLPDAVNTIGSEADRRYGDIVEWNSPPLPNQKGSFKPAIEFSACRFRDDHVRMRSGPEVDVLSIFKGDLFIGPTIKKFDDVILLNQHKCQNPMILIWNGSNVSDARVSGAQFGQFPNNSKATLGEYYNYPMWFDSQLAGNMYTNFWFIDNPRSSGFQGKLYEATIELTCARLQIIDLDGMVKTSEGIGKVDSIEINYVNKKIKIRGEI